MWHCKWKKMTSALLQNRFVLGGALGVKRAICPYRRTQIKLTGPKWWFTSIHTSSSRRSTALFCMYVQAGRCLINKIQWLNLSLCVYCGFQFTVFLGFMSVQMSGSLILVSSFWLLSFSWFFYLIWCGSYSSNQIVFCLIIFWYYLFKFYSFIMR